MASVAGWHGFYASSWQHCELWWGVCVAFLPSAPARPRPSFQTPGSSSFLAWNAPCPHSSLAPSLLSRQTCVCPLSCSVVSHSLRPHGLQPARLLCPWGVSRQEYCSGLPCPSPGDLPRQTRSSQPQAHYSGPQVFFPPGPSSLFRLHPACRTRLHKGPLHQPGQRWSQPPLQPGPWGPPASITLTV